MTEIGYIIEPGQRIPDDVTGFEDRDNDTWALSRNGRGWMFARNVDRYPDDSGISAAAATVHAPLTVTAVREPKPERTLIGPPHAHLDAPCTDKCYETASAEPEPQQADTSALLDLVRQYGDERRAGGQAVLDDNQSGADIQRHEDAARRLLDRIAALVPQQRDPRLEAPEAHAYSRGFNNGRDSMAAELAPADPSVLSLPQVPDGAIGLVGKSGRSYPRQVDELSSRVWWQCGPNAVWSTGKLLDEDGPATVVMREPRTWPRLDTISNDLKAVRGASGKVYHRSHFSQSVPVFRERGNDGDPLTGPGHMFYALQTFDGPLTEVFDDEPGGEPR